MSSKILLVVLLFCGLAGRAQTMAVWGRNKVAVTVLNTSATVHAIHNEPRIHSLLAYDTLHENWIEVGGTTPDTAQPKNHWHSWSLNRDIEINAKDSAYKYWKLQMIWQDSVSVYKASPGKYPAWVGKYYERQESQYNRKSIYYKEKQ